MENTFTLKSSNAPYVRNKKSTFQIMIELTIALGIVWLAAVITTFIKAPKYGIHSIFLMVVAVLVTFACDAINTVLRNKKDKELPKKILHDITHNYSWVTAMIFTLTVPVWTSYYVVICGAIFATVIGKLVFGGFGKNIFNPAIMGRIFVALSFTISTPAMASGLDATTGATVTGAISSINGWLGDASLSGISTLDLWTGNYFGAMGETFSILLIVLFIVLAIREDLNWRAPVFYVGTIAITSLLIALVTGMRDIPAYLSYSLATGGLLFGAVFMITDPVTTPTSPVGNIFVGIFAGLMTMLIRIFTNNAEGVMYSIALVNLITPAIDHVVTAKTTKHVGYKAGVTFGTMAATIALVTTLAYFHNGGKEVYEKNGIAIEEYSLVTSKITLKENQDIAKYEKDLPTTSSLVDTNGYAKAYSVIDSSNKEVGVILHVLKSNISIVEKTEGYEGEVKVKAEGLVTFDLTTKSITNISFIKAPASNSTYTTKVEDALSDYTYSNDFSSFEITSASYSTEGVKAFVNEALTVFNALNA
jgi:electron transport complex protein RnfD